jgi:hypothetical protein
MNQILESMVRIPAPILYQPDETESQPGQGRNAILLPRSTEGEISQPLTGDGVLT